MPGLELNTANHSVAAENVTAGQERKQEAARAPFISLFSQIAKATARAKESQQPKAPPG